MSLNDNLDEHAEVTLFRHATLSGLQMAAGTSVFVFKSHSWTDPPASTQANKAVCTWVETGVKLKRKVFNVPLVVKTWGGSFKVVTFFGVNKILI